MLLGRVVSNTGTQIHRVALTALVLSVYGPRVYGVTMTLAAVPPIVFIILGGVVCDRYPKHRIMAATDFLSGVVFALLAICIATDSLTALILYIGVVVASAAGSLFKPASASIIPYLVPKSEIGRATSVSAASDSAIAIGGPGLGGTLTALLGSAAVFAVNSLSFLLSGISELFIKESKVANRSDTAHPLRAIVDGVRYFAKDRTLSGVAVVFGFLNLVGTPLFFYPPIFAAERFDQSAFGIGLTFIALGIGGALFSLFLYIRRDFARKGLMMLAGTALAGLLGATLPFIGSFVTFLGALTLMGATFGININLLNIIVQTRVDHQFLGRVHSLLLLLVTALVPIGYAVFTWLLAAVGLKVATLAGSISVFAGAFGFFLIPGFRRL